ncbi:hypothetical protein J8L98_04105 [Pseudoalteromonas sp. MMG013]|uniref:hypothetical protein n=1 Tax=Pseudoalteromonas sp. MMG013 TaxID=2822687 RepID=UPI001B378B51|nr:hypothetical protein [Pseudoalteromonas sp. MMG013]MBQ4860879.1 hypothetical protein [Pseudoalteromonas sp. MMG013]
MNLKTELGNLLFYFERGRNTYARYLECGSTYLYARILKDNNDRIIEILSNVYSVCPTDIQRDILELTHHIDVWISHWNCLENQLNPDPNDEFIFQNTVRYPRGAESNIVSYYEGLI